MRSKCGNCNWKGEPKIGLLNIPALAERLDEGGVVPSGECPKCSALCYPLKSKSKHVAHAVLIHHENKDRVMDKTGWEVKIPNKHKAATEWFTVAECYANPMTGDAKETAIKIAALLNGD